MKMDNTFSPPVIDAPILLSFGEALKELATGKKITRIEWNNTDYGFLKNGIVAIHKNGEDFDTWRISDADILATDWIVK
jgi:hypothetical protein